MVFKFLKKKEKEAKLPLPPVRRQGAKLEIPPPPVSEEDLPEFPEIPEIKEEPFPKAPPIKKPVPSFPEMGKKLKLPTPRPPIPSGEELEEEAFEEEKRKRARTEFYPEAIKPLFVKMESFQSVINELNLIKSITKESEDAVIRVGDFAEDQEKEFNRWQGQLTDLQKKLIFIDKTIFKE